jgi:hypothetical protein
MVQPRGIDLFVTLNVLERQLDRPRCLLGDVGAEFRLQARTGFQQIVYLGFRVTKWPLSSLVEDHLPANARASRDAE